MFPLIVPPPETIENVPPEGDAVNFFVSFSVIVLVVVVLSATSHGKQTVTSTASKS